MGACDVSGSFISYDWRKGIEEVQANAAAEYGHQEGYSGAANCVDFGFKGDYRGKLKTQKQISDFISDRLESLYKRDGEVICVGNAYVMIYTTAFTENTSLDIRPILGYADSKKPATVCYRDYYRGGDIRVVGSGTVAECKQIAHQFLRKNNYGLSVDIICKRTKKIIHASGKGTKYKTTKRRTDEKHLVVPFYEYVYYGWAPC